MVPFSVAAARSLKGKDSFLRCLGHRVNELIEGMKLLTEQERNL